MKLKRTQILGAVALAFGSVAAQASHVVSAVNMMHCDLILINAETDEMVMTPLMDLPGWPEAVCQHSWILPDESKVFISTDANQGVGAKVAAISIKKIDWANKKVDLSLDALIPMGKAATLSSIPVPTQTSPLQPIPPVPSAWFPKYSQIHGPTLLPGTDFSYLTGYTDSNIYVINNKTNKLVSKQSFGNASRQIHGIYFNSIGSLGLSAPYQFDLNQVNVYRPNRRTGVLTQLGAIRLGSRAEYAAFSHFVTWVGDRHAFIGTMQSDKTSLTPSGAKVIGPSVWRLDTATLTATRVLSPTPHVNGTGVYRPASDVAVVGNTLIVAEEDTLDGAVGPGYIAFFDITDLNRPRLIKRLVPGVDLPDDFKVAHVISVTGEQTHAYVSSYHSNHLLKLEIATQKVVKVYSAADGLDMPHGEFISGNLR